MDKSQIGNPIYYEERGESVGFIGNELLPGSPKVSLNVYSKFFTITDLPAVIFFG